MTIISNAWAVLGKSYVAWTVYFGLAAQLVFDLGLGTSLPGWATVILLLLILMGRLVKQPTISGEQPAEEEFKGDQV